LAVASLAVAAWEQPRMQVIGATTGDAHCAVPRVAKATVATKPDHDLLLFMFGFLKG
jgi:hypothetical protein